MKGIDTRITKLVQINSSTSPTGIAVSGSRNIAALRYIGCDQRALHVQGCLRRANTAAVAAAPYVAINIVHSNPALCRIVLYSRRDYIQHGIR